jgi:hypothetical protein
MVGLFLYGWFCVDNQEIKHITRYFTPNIFSICKIVTYKLHLYL